MSYQDIDLWRDPVSISKETAANVLYHFHREGFQGGSFTETLLTAFTRADHKNFNRLAAAFPELGEAVYIVQNKLDGVDQLRAIVRGE